MRIRSGSGNVSIVRYGDVFRVCVFRSDRVFDPKPGGDPGRAAKPPEAAERKRENNISRARRAVWELAMCNPWEWFATFTLDAGKYDRHDLERFRSDLAQWVRNRRRLSGLEIRYLIVPEMHRDGAWHAHGLLSGCGPELVRFAHPAPRKLVEGGYYDWPRYREKFGFCSFGPVRDHGAVSAYITKYVSKSFAADAERSRAGELGKHLYYASQGLARGELVYRGSLVKDLGEAAWENEYVKIYNLKRFPLENIDTVNFPLGVVPDSVVENVLKEG